MSLGACSLHGDMKRGLCPSPATHSYICILFLIFGILSTLAMAQAPLPVYGMSFDTAGEHTLYVHGGLVSVDTQTKQLFSLDLTKLSLTNPKWKNLTLDTDAQPTSIYFANSMMVSKDQQSLTIWGQTVGVSVYNIADNFWGELYPFPSSYSETGGTVAVTDPASGLIYIAFGAVGNKMMEYNPITKNSRLLPMPEEISQNGIIIYYSFVWSTQRGSLLLYGGFTGNYSNPRLFEYTPSTTTWRIVSTTGESPGDLNTHCMVPAYGGSKMVVFGGRSLSRIFSNGIYTLDLASLTWTRGTDIDPSKNRIDMACATSGDNFVAWGGSDIYGNSLGSLVIYNFKTNTWATPGSSKGAIVGATIGVLAVIIALGLFAFRRRVFKMRRTKRYRESRENLTLAMESDYNSGGASPENIPIPEFYSSGVNRR